VGRIKPEIVEVAREMLRKGTGISDISRELDVSSDGIRRHLNPEYRESRNQSSIDSYHRNPKKKRKWRPKPKHPPIGMHTAGLKTEAVVVPDEVLAERDYAMRYYQDVTSEVFGDPLPGRSALSKKLRGE
jgi:hypothetical protein